MDKLLFFFVSYSKYIHSVRNVFAISKKKIISLCKKKFQAQDKLDLRRMHRNYISIKKGQDKALKDADKIH